MIYWKIQTDKGQAGFLVLDDDRNNGRLLDDAGAPLDGEFCYTVTDNAPAIPAWGQNA